MSKPEQSSSSFLYIIAWVISIGMITSGLERNSNPGLPVAGAILIFTLVYASLKEQ